MTIKLIALVSAACVAVLFIPSLLFPHDPYFDLLISTNKIVLALRLILIAGMLFIALKPRHKFKYRETHKLILAIASLLASFALVGLVDQRVDWALFNVFKPMDYFFYLMGASFMFITYFEYDRGRRRLHLERLALPKPELPKLPKPAFVWRRGLLTRTREA